MIDVFDWARHPLANLTRYAELGRLCFDDVGRFEECDRVWAIFGIILALACALTLAYIARKFYLEYSAYRRVRQRRLAEMEIAPSNVMNQFRWSGENGLDPGLSHEEIVQRIKEAKLRQRGEANSSSDNKPGGDPALGVGIRHR